MTAEHSASSRGPGAKSKAAGRRGARLFGRWPYFAASGVLTAIAVFLLAFSAAPQPVKQAQAADEPEAEKAEPDDQAFQETVRPFLKTYCFDCHGPDLEMEGVGFHKYKDTAAVRGDRKTWEKVLAKLEVGAMPPDDHEPRPGKDERQQVVDWIDRTLFSVDCDPAPDPGRVTIRRLNRNEYNNTIRDLVGVEFEPAADFPSDDVGYGFDNIGDVLSLPPLLMEKYLDAAEQIAEAAVVTDVGAGHRRRFEGKNLDPGAGRRSGRGFIQLASTGEVSARVEFPYEGRYVLRAEAAADQAGDEPARMEFRLDGKKVKVHDIKGERKPAVYEAELRVEKGERKFAAAFINDYYKPEADDPGERDRNLAVRWLEVEGPLDVERDDLPQSHRRIVTCRPGQDKSVRDCAVEIFRRFATRAYRRPVTGEELAGLADLVEAVVQQGASFEQAVQVGMQAVLVSPHFLFRVELDERPNDPQAVHRVGDYALASRLSYFLWSSMPDEELFRLAEERRLHAPEVLEAQVRRMLQDRKSAELVRNFGRQWLNLRNLAEMQPDPKRFPTFNERLREDMLRETDLFFETVIREDRSILDFLDARFTFVNGRLAEHYGIAGAEGEKFRRVSLEGTQRAGVLTHASVLTITSDPTKTKPVLRGKWILENILGTPPPPPPAGVPDLEETAKANPDASLKEQLALHRTNPTCASCHNRMDPLGFGFENFDPIGRWREKDGGHEIDASGQLPEGERFNSPLELVEILRQRDEQFARCFAEKLLTFALGRGLEYYDKCAVDEIVAKAKQEDYRFSALVLAVVRSDPFLRRRGELSE